MSVVGCLLKSKIGDKITIIVNGKNKIETVIHHAWMERTDSCPAANYPVSEYGVIHPHYNTIVSIKKRSQNV